jgi:hypothetical protein
VVVKQFIGRGRRATTRPESRRGGWLFRLYMKWFSGGMKRR